MADQLVFDLPFRAAMGRDDFLVSRTNMAAVKGIDRWRDWPFGKAVLVGPEGAGKSHLAHVWAAQSGARIVAAAGLTADWIDRADTVAGLALEDADRLAGDRAAETLLFHLHNALATRSVPLLVTARQIPNRWGLVLPDLESRMAQADVLQAAPPDDALLMALMVKLARDRQMRLTPDLIRYAMPRIERTFAAVRSLMAELDARSLAAREPPMRKHIRAILEGARGAPSTRG